MGDSLFTLFYAWQSDSPAGIGRSFVEDAATKALKQVHASGVLDLAPRLDKDTKGVPGMPDIANTILQKIEDSSAILADLSFIGRNYSGGEGKKLLPNPNVLLELGYAIAHLGWERVICVMNTHYGDKDDLPFDLRHRRWPLSYCLPPDADAETRNRARAQLTNDIRDAITGIAQFPPGQRKSDVSSRLDAIENLLSSMTGTVGQIEEMRASIDRIQREVVQEAEDRDSPENRTRLTLDGLVRDIRDGNFEGVSYRQGMLGIVVSPVTPPETTLPLFDKENQIRVKLRPLYSSAWDHRRHGTSFVTFSRRESLVDAVSEIREDGLIRAAGHEVITVNRRDLDNANIPEDMHIIPSIAFENSIVEAIHEYIGLLIEFRVSGPWMVGISLFNLGTSVLYVGRPLLFDGRPYTGETITPPVLRVPEDTNINSPQSVAQVLRPAFDFIWREHNFPRSLNYSFDGKWTGR